MSAQKAGGGKTDLILKFFKSKSSITIRKTELVIHFFLEFETTSIEVFTFAAPKKFLPLYSIFTIIDGLRFMWTPSLDGGYSEKDPVSGCFS